MPRLLPIILSLLIIGSIYCAYELHQRAKELVTLKKDLAEVNRIGYGILSINAWKDRVSEILILKVDEFALSEGNRVGMKTTVESALNRLLDELEVLFENNKTQGNILNRIKAEALGLFIDVDEFRPRVPEFADAVLDELEKPESRKALKVFILEKLEAFTAATASGEDLRARNRIIRKYNAEDPVEATRLLNKRIEKVSSLVWMLGFLMMGAVVLGFLAWWGLRGQRDTLAFALLILVCLAPLWSGVSTPMIDIDARIESFNFVLMGEPLSFENQILYFQSKSILDVVHILVTRGKTDTILVGILIIMFSVIFPIFKMTCTMATAFRIKLIQHPVIRFFVLKSSKWSMADVFVVSIFMAYIGFKGVIASQLGQLSRDEVNLDIITTDHTSLQVGFCLFLTFTLAGLVLSSIAEQRFTAKG